MEAVTISSRFQVVIPKDIRKKLNLAPGQKVQAIGYDDRIELIPVRSMREMRGFLKGIDPKVRRDAVHGESRPSLEGEHPVAHATRKGGGKRKPLAGDVEGYLAAIPKDARAALEELRRAILAAAPGASEVISYQIPAFKYEGKLLVSFAAFEKHCSFFLMSTDVMRTHAADLEGYALGKGSIRFTADKPLPAALVKKLVKARIAENEKGRKR